jgi:hypothetical protein
MDNYMLCTDQLLIVKCNFPFGVPESFVFVFFFFLYE